MDAASRVELSLIVPVFQEELAIPLFLDRTIPVLASVTADFEIIFVMDPGRDRTEEVIRERIAREPRIRLLLMTRRWGQDACMVAGIEHCRGDVCVIIDVDLQDPPELIPAMYRKWKDENFNVVYAERRTRHGDPAGRRAFAYAGYWLLNRISEVKIPRNIGDFRLIDRRVIEGLRQLKETHGFLRGLVPYVGYRQTSIPYDREERKTGRTKYSAVFGSMKHGWNGIVAFSSVPLSMMTALGFAAAGLSLAMTMLYVLMKVVRHEPLLTGLGPILLLVTFLGGVQLISLGVMGEYVSRIYEEVRQRPKYMIAEKINFGGDVSP